MPAPVISLMPEEELFGEPGEPDVSGALVDTGAPYDVAKVFVEDRFTADGAQTLHHHKGGFHQWGGTAYAALEDEAIRAKLYHFLDRCETAGRKNGETKPVKPNAALVRNVA